MVKCPKCGAEVKYIPLCFATMSAAIVAPEYIEVIQDNGRAVKGHILHVCPAKEGAGKKEGQNG